MVIQTLTPTDAQHNISVLSGQQATYWLHLDANQAELTMHVDLDVDAECTVLLLHEADTQPVRITQTGTLADGATMHWQVVTLGGSKVEHSIETELMGSHAMSSIDWVFYASGSEQQSLRARNIFNGREGGGEMLLKGVAEEQAILNVDGMIDIGLTGGGTDTYLTEEVLMLDPTAKVNAIPGLEIKTNDVKASHSATVSRVTEEDLFYFGARGIAPRAARKMYIEGFLGDITQKIADEDIREQVVQAIDRKYSA